MARTKNTHSPEFTGELKKAEHPALAILEEIEAKMKPLGEMNRHDTAWVKAKIAEAKAKL